MCIIHSGYNAIFKSSYLHDMLPEYFACAPHSLCPVITEAKRDLSDHMELEIQMVVSHRVSAEN